MTTSQFALTAAHGARIISTARRFSMSFFSLKNCNNVFDVYMSSRNISAIAVGIVDILSVSPSIVYSKYKHRFTVSYIAVTVMYVRRCHDRG